MELSLTVQNVDAADTVVTVNRELARSYQQALRDLSEELCIKNDTSASLIARFPDVLATRHADVDEEQLWEDVSAVTAQALETFVQMRAAEGAKMKADVREPPVLSGRVCRQGRDAERRPGGSLHQPPV